MLYSTLLTLHVLSILIWIGGMAFAQFFLRPAVASLDAPVRLPLMHAVLKRFFGAVTYASLLALCTGFWLMGNSAQAVVQAGGTFTPPLDWSVMAVLGTLMVLIFGHMRFALFTRLSRAVATSDWAQGQGALQTIRTWVWVNLLLGLFIVALTLLL